MVTLLFSLPLGLLICFGRMSKEPSDPGNCFRIHFCHARNPADASVDGCIFWTIFYFRYPYFHGIQSDRSIYCICSINYAAYFAEIYRGGIESIAVGQYEAAKILGYSKAQTFFRIILPQVIQENPAVCDKRGDHTGKRYFPWLLSWR